MYDSSGSHGQQIKTARVLPDNGQTVFIVPSPEMREVLLGRREADEITGEMQKRRERLISETDEQEPESIAAVKTDSPTSLYDKALALLRDRKAPAPALARKHLHRFMDYYPGSNLMPNVFYWLGETYYTEKRYDKAIDTFRKVIQTYPRHPKAPDALLKIGYSYEKLNEIPNARYHLEDLVQRYPKSGSAKLAQTKLQEWK